MPAEHAVRAEHSQASLEEGREDANEEGDEGDEGDEGGRVVECVSACTRLAVWASAPPSRAHRVAPFVARVALQPTQQADELIEHAAVGEAAPTRAARHRTGWRAAWHRVAGLSALADRAAARAAQHATSAASPPHLPAYRLKQHAEQRRRRRARPPPPPGGGGGGGGAGAAAAAGAAAGGAAAAGTGGGAAASSLGLAQTCLPREGEWCA